AEAAGQNRSALSVAGPEVGHGLADLLIAAAPRREALSRELLSRELLSREAGPETAVPQAVAPGKAPPPTTSPANFSANSPDNSPDNSPANGPDAFVERLRQPALAAAEETGIPAELMLAQAALETGWGRYRIPTADGGDSHNL